MKKLLLILGLLIAQTALCDAPLIWQSGQYAKFLTSLGWNLNTGETYRSLSVDPTAAAGVSAQIGSIGVRNNGGSGELWFKTGAGNTAWANALTSSSGWSLLGNAGTNAAVNFMGTTDAVDVIFKRNSTELARLISGAFQAPNIAGGSAAADNIVISSTTNASKGAVTIGQNYKEFSSGKTRWGNIAAGVPTLSSFEFTQPTAGINDTFGMTSPGGTTWTFDVADGFFYFYKRPFTSTAWGVDTANRVVFGDDSPNFRVMVSNSSAQTTVSSASTSDPVLVIKNRSNTANDFSALLGENTNNAWDSGLFMIHDTHAVAGSQSGSLELWVSNAGTRQRAIDIAKDKIITLDAYGTGILHSSVAGVVSSSAVDLASSDVTGILPMANGGTNKNMTASNGAVAYSDADSLELSAVGTAVGQVLQSNGAAAPTWSTATYPSSTTINRILYSSANNVVSQIATANSSVLVTNGSGVPSWTSTLGFANGGTGFSSYTDGQLLIGNTATGGLSRSTLTAGAGISITNGNGSITVAATGGGGAGMTRFSLHGNVVPYEVIDGVHRHTSTQTLTNVYITMLDSGTSGSTVIKLRQYRSGYLVVVSTASLYAASGAPASTSALLSSSLDLIDGDIIACDVVSVAGGNPSELSVEF